MRIDVPQPSDLSYPSQYLHARFTVPGASTIPAQLANLVASPIAALFAVVFVLLACANLCGLLLRRLRPQWRLHDFMQRLTSWWIVTVLMLLVAGTAPWPGTALMGVFILLALHECWRALWPTRRDLLWFALPWLVLTLAHPLRLLQSGQSVALLLFCWIMLLTQLNDIAQYFAGKALGRHRIAPRLSPNKTWEGLLGGVLFTTLLSSSATPLLLPLTHLEALGFGLLLGLGGFAGDLLFSWLKRSAGIKDFGTVLPGQGGVLDRLDSLTCTAPLCMHYTLLLAGA